MTIRNDILAGVHDDELADIEEAVRLRMKANAGKMVARTIEPGAEVEINDKISPRYLIGLRAKVVGRAKGNSTKIPCELLADSGRFRAGSPVNIPAVCLDLVA